LSFSTLGEQVIEVDRLKKSYGDRLAVDGIEFFVPSGSTFGFLGPNGAGKSTTLAMLVGLITPDDGRVKVAGGNPREAAVRRGIGIAPQALSLYEELSAADNLTFFGKMYGLRGQHLRSRVRWGLQFAELEDRARDRVRTFSGGMKRRLNIAVGLIHEPQVLLLDEPTVGVDTQSRNHILESISQLAKAGLTLIYTTHYMDEAERLCDQVAIMDQGRILANEPIDQLLSQHGGNYRVTGKLIELPEVCDTDADGHRTASKLSSSTSVALRTPGPFEFRAEDPVALLAEMHSKGARFSDLKIDKPNLEDVFLSLTGRSLRD
jgi:ABC-2 type transport system ATP-binding protein